MHPKDRNTILEIAREQHEVSIAYAECAEQRWRPAIELLETTEWDDPVLALRRAMDTDPVVIDARREEAEAKDLLDQATQIAKES